MAAFRTALNLDPRQADVHYELAEALLAQTVRNPFLPHTNWVEARAAVLEGLARTSDKVRGTKLLARIEAAREDALI